MSGASRKTPFVQTSDASTKRRIADAVQLAGKALPCYVIGVGASGTIVTIAFEVNSAPYTLPNVTVPVIGPEYIRFPIQTGCKGVVFPVDARIGGVTGLGAGTPNLVQPGNLSALVFCPVGNKGFFATPDANSLVLYGPNGVILTDAAQDSHLTLTSSGVTMDKMLTVAGNTSFGGGARKVVLDGDPVTGGVVHASSTTIVAT